MGVNSAFQFKGSVTKAEDLPTDAIVGDVYLCADTGATMIYVGDNHYDELLPISDLTSITQEPEAHYPIVKTRCDCCGASLPISKTDRQGVCKCEFCKSENYVW